MSDVLEMSGVWYGRWTAETRNIPPNSFIAHLTEAHGHVGGSITEPDRERRVAVLRANVDGMRAGQRVQFTKQYDGTGRLAHAVFYNGRVSGDGTEVKGQWRFSSYSGNFTMQREGFSVEEMEEQEDIEEPVTGVLR